MRAAWILITAVLMLAGCSQQAVPAEKAPPVDLRSTPQPGLNYVAVIGDSFTAGSPAGGAKSSPANWVNRVSTELRGRGVDIRASVGAIGGTGYASAGRKATSGLFSEQVRQVVGYNDNLVVLFGSRNDSQIDPALLAPKVHDTLTQVRKLAPNAKILMVGPVWTNATPTLAVQANRDVLKAQAAEFGATFVDPLAEKWFWDRPDLLGPDGVHPTDAGHGYIAERMTPVIEHLLAPPPTG